MVFRMLQETAVQQGRKNQFHKQEMSEYESLMHQKGPMNLSGDPLDLGMGLWTCHFYPHEEWSQIFTRQVIALANNLFDGNFTDMSGSASKRLAFRDFGARLGVHCVESDEALKEQVSKLIEFWEGHIHQHDTDGLKQISRSCMRRQ